jgi:hypothetical protein
VVRWSLKFTLAPPGHAMIDSALADELSDEVLVLLGTSERIR